MFKFSEETMSSLMSIYHFSDGTNIKGTKSKEKTTSTNNGGVKKPSQKS